MIHIQHEISVLLSHTSEQDQPFDKLLELICLKPNRNVPILECIDSGGLYLVDPKDGSLNLVAHVGFSEEFINAILYYSSDSINANIVNEGKPIYGDNIAGVSNGIKSTAIIPLHYKNKAIACLNLASHTQDIIPEDTREVLESIALDIGGAIARIRSEQDLREIKQNFLTFFNTIEDFLFIINTEGNIIETNNWVKSKLEYSENELKNMPVTQIHPLNKKEEVLSIISDMLNGDIEYCFIPLLSKNGKLIPVETKVVKGIWDNKDALFGISRDITKRKEAENNLQLALKQLEIANETKDKFFSIIAHDLRNPISNLMQISEIISKNKKIDNTLIDAQKKLSKNTYHLLDNLLNWARYNKNQIEYNPEIINIKEIINENIEKYDYEVHKKNISIKLNYDEKDINCLADKNMIDLIIRNLLSNAIKFNNNNGQIKIDIVNNDFSIIIKISDTGIGIPIENIERIFSENEFFTTYGTSNEKGNGLGLKLCKYFIEINKGKLTIESEINKGSSLSFSLPKI